MMEKVGTTAARAIFQDSPLHSAISSLLCSACTHSGVIFEKYYENIKLYILHYILIDGMWMLLMTWDRKDHGPKGSQRNQGL